MIVQAYKEFMKNLSKDYKDFYDKLIFVLIQKERQIKLYYKEDYIVFDEGVWKHKVENLPFFAGDIKKLFEYFRAMDKRELMIFHIRLNNKIIVVDALNVKEVNLVSINFKKQEIMYLEKDLNEKFCNFYSNNHLLFSQIYKIKKVKEKIDKLYEYYKQRFKHINYIKDKIKELQQQVKLYKKL